MRRISPEAAIGLTAGRALSIDRISGGGTPEWVAQDGAHAAKDLDRRAWISFMYKYAGDDSLRSDLFGCLLNETIGLKQYEQWPDRVAGEKYIERMVWLAIAEDKFPIIGMLKCWPAFIRKQPIEIRALSDRDTHIRRLIQQASVTDEDEHFWNQVSRRYQGVHDILIQWNAMAHRKMAPRLCDEAA